MKVNELRNKTSKELSDELLENMKEQFVLRMQQASGQLNRPSEMKKVRRNIARIKTVMNEMQTHGAGK